MLNYLLNNFFTFGSDKTHHTAEAKFYTLEGLGWALNGSLMGWLAHGHGWNDWLAKVFATRVCLAWSFSGGK